MYIHKCFKPSKCLPFGNVQMSVSIRGDVYARVAEVIVLCKHSRLKWFFSCTKSRQYCTYKLKQHY